MFFRSGVKAALLVGALGLAACHGSASEPDLSAPVETLRGAPSRIVGQPLLILERSNLFAVGPGCRGAADFALYDDGHVVYCDITSARLGVDKGRAQYRVAQLTPAALKRFTAGLPLEGFAALAPSSLLDPGADDLPRTRIDLRVGSGWHHVTVRGSFRTEPPGLRQRLQDLLAGVVGRRSPAPEPFLSVYRALTHFRTTSSEAFVPDAFEVTLTPMDGSGDLAEWPRGWPLPQAAGGTLLLEGTRRSALEALAERGGVRIGGRSFRISWEAALPGAERWR